MKNYFRLYLKSSLCYKSTIKYRSPIKVNADITPILFVLLNNSINYNVLFYVNHPRNSISKI